MSSELGIMLANQPNAGYSAKVRIELRLGGHQYKVAQIGGSRLYFSEPMLLPAESGEVILVIDGREQRWNVTLQPGPQPSHVIETIFH